MAILARKARQALRIVGFIDDAEHKTGTRVLGYPVLGGFERLERLIDTASVDMVVIGARSIDPERIRNLRVACASNSVAMTRLTVGIEDMIVPFGATASRGGPSAG